MRYNIPQERARLLFWCKYALADSAMVAMRAWVVPRSARNPEGFKYSMAYIDSYGNRLLGYDNAEGKGHHRHEGKEQTSFDFASMEDLVGRFLSEVAQIRGSAP